MPNMNETKNIFSLKLLFPKDMNMDWIKNAWAKAAQEEFNNPAPYNLRPLFSAGNPYDDKGAIMDGDWKYGVIPEEKKDQNESYRGMWVMGFTADELHRPMIVDENKNEVLDPSTFQSGDYARVVAELSSYTSKQFKTPQVSIRFSVVQKIREGEHFSGGMSKETALNMLGDAPSEAVNNDLDGLY